MFVIIALKKNTAFIKFNETKVVCKITEIKYHNKLIQPKIFMQTLPLLSGYHDVRFRVNYGINKVYYNTRMTFPPRYVNDLRMPNHLIIVNHISKTIYDNNPTFTFECNYTLLNNLD